VGLATFSKITNGLLLLPMVAWWAWRREWRRGMAVAVVWGAITAALFGANVVISGDWNYQGGARKTYYGRYPFQSPDTSFAVGSEMARDESLAGVIFDRDYFWTNLRANLKYSLVGRYAGLLPYFFPAVFAVGLLLITRRGRASWQWFVLAGVAAHVVLFMVSLPYNYFGSAGSVGNRYFMGVYGACVFLWPPIRSIALAAAAWLVGGIFVANIVLHPYAASVKPADPAKSGPLRLFPVELTSVNDLPINTESHRVRVWYGDTGAGDPGFQIYHLDDNAYLPEADRKSFWIRGGSRAEMLFKADRAYSHTRLRLTAGLVPTEVTIKVGGRTSRLSLAAGASTEIRVPLGPAFPYKRYEAPLYVWVVSIASSAGFTPPPPPDGSTADTRFLGVRVLPTIGP
jgi:hypothetical protein